MNYDELISHLAAVWQVRVTDCRVVDYHLLANVERERFDYDSHIIGDSEIILGRYPGEDEVRFAAFLHELGHISGDRSKFLNEAKAWDAAKRIAQELGVIWTPAMESYRLRCLKTYE